VARGAAVPVRALSATYSGPIAVRAHVPPRNDKKGRPRRRSAASNGLAIVLDFETTTDETQRLTFGSFRVYDGRHLLREGLVHADDLAKPEVALLREYVDKHSDDSGGRIALMSRSEFVEEVLWRIGYVARAAIVGFNLAFDLSRLALGQTRAENGGFSVQLYESRDVEGRVWSHKWRPNVTIKHLGSKRQFLSFTRPLHVDPENLIDGQPYRGRFVDLRMAAFALTDRSHSLASAATAFGVSETKAEVQEHGVITPDYIDYNRQDVRTTWALYEAVRTEWDRHPPDLPLEQLYSGASVGKAYLGAMGIRPPAEKARSIGHETIGHHMSAYAGGRAECRIRLTPMPVRYLDLVSQYPTVFKLLDLWRYETASQLVSEDATERARDWLDRVTRESLHDPAVWRDLACVVCLVQPHGELLPARAKYESLDGAWTIGLNELETDTPIWVTLADLAVAKILGGSAPNIIEANRIVPVGTQRGLRVTALRGEISIDPRTENFFGVAIEARQRVKRDAARVDDERERLERFLKVVCNSTSYGVPAEVRVSEPLREPVKVTAYGLTALDARVRALESPGPYSFPPLAATITGAGRLLLALIQADLAALGGSYVGTDTDSVLVVASPEGGLVPCPGGPHRLPDGGEAVLALSDDQVDGIRREINRLNPYTSDAVPDLLKLEEQNFALDGSGRRVELRAIQISPKRYVLYERHGDDIALRKVSEHGLGLYRPPIARHEGSWYYVVWERIVRKAEGLPVGDEPAWFDLPAVSQLAISSPALLAPFRRMNEGKSFRDQVKPQNFMLIGHVDPLTPLPDGLSISDLTAVAPYTSAPAEYLRQPWINRLDGGAIAVTTKIGGISGTVRLKTYRDVFDEYGTHPDHKSGDRRGGPATRGSIGLLPRLRVVATEVRHVGKESNRLDEVEEGLISDPEAVYIEYRDERREWEWFLPRLRQVRGRCGPSVLATHAGISERALRYALNAGKLPHRPAREALMAIAKAQERS
jgi:hypothetical protein